VGAGVESGSGWVAVVSMDRGEQCGSNGTHANLWLWLWRWLGGSKASSAGKKSCQKIVIFQALIFFKKLTF
jgi:hypothetical protein